MTLSCWESLLWTYLYWFSVKTIVWSLLKRQQWGVSLSPWVTWRQGNPSRLWLMFKTNQHVWANSHFIKCMVESSAATQLWAFFMQHFLTQFIFNARIVLYKPTWLAGGILGDQIIGSQLFMIRIWLVVSCSERSSASLATNSKNRHILMITKGHGFLSKASLQCCSTFYCHF